MALDPIVEQMLTQMAEAGGPTLAEMTLADARAMYRMMGENFSRPQMDSIEDTTANGVSVRIYRPSAADKLPCLVYFHGGGWVIGDLESHDNVCRTLADQIGCVVIATDYRLSPEHPFPAPLDDCYTVTRWAADNADALNIDAAKIAVGGDSAGGNLSACVALRIKQEGGPALVHQLLMCPVTDAAMDTASYSENAEGYMLTRDTMTWFFGHYLGDTDSKNPYISPLHAEDLSGLPPATVITAQYDPLRDEGEAYAGRLKAAGVDTVAERFDGMIHNFMTMTGVLPSAQVALDLATERIKSAFKLG